MCAPALDSVNDCDETDKYRSDVSNWTLETDIGDGDEIVALKNVKSFSFASFSATRALISSFFKRSASDARFCDSSTTMRKKRSLNHEPSQAEMVPYPI